MVYALALDTSTGIYDTTIANNLGTDPVASDFYLVSTNGGATFDILYINDQVSSSQGVIKKYSWANDIWNACGAFTNATGVDGLFATTNGSGGVYLFYSTGAGGTAGNSIVRVTDSAGWNQPINIISSNVIYTAGKTASIKGLTFVPQLVAYNNQLIPPPVLTAQNGAKVNGLFSVTNTPDDPAWRAAITGITVNGATLPAAAYDLTQAGLIVFNPSQSALLQSSGSKSIVFSATGYSTNSIAQGLGVAPAAQLVITRQPSSPIGDGGALGAQPVVKVEDLYGNVVTNSSLIAAAPVQNTWTLGGTSTVTNSLGVATYAGLTAFSTNAINGAAILFATGGLTVTSSAFNIPAPIKSQLGGVRIASGKVAFNFTNFTGLSYTVLATNLLTAPVSTWPAIGTAVESPAGSGNYQFTNTAATNAELYYILRQP